MGRKHLAALAVATLAVTGFAACGDDDDDSPDDVETPDDTGGDGGAVTLPITTTS